jgi:hypothetical protein
LWLSPFHPALVAYGIIAFDLNFLLQAAKNAVRTVVAYLKILQAQQISQICGTDSRRISKDPPGTADLSCLTREKVGRRS